MHAYLDLLKQIKETGIKKGDRTGTGTISLFGPQIRMNLQDGFPLLTTKKLHLKSIIHELLWFLKGDTNIKYLNDNGVTIWDEWADENGNLGPIYGNKWVTWDSYKPMFIDYGKGLSNGNELNVGAFEKLEINQIDTLIHQLKHNPNDRRMVVTAWDPAVLPLPGKTFSENVNLGRAALPPCHMFWQCWVGDGKLSLKMYIRSWDYFLGAPFNIASYALLQMMLAQVTGLELGDLIITAGDAHIYLNHLEQVDLQLSRTPMPQLPIMKLNPDVKNIYHFKYEDFKLENYDPHPRITALISV